MLVGCYCTTYETIYARYFYKKNLYIIVLTWHANSSQQENTTKRT